MGFSASYNFHPWTQNAIYFENAEYSHVFMQQPAGSGVNKNVDVHLEIIFSWIDNLYFYNESKILSSSNLRHEKAKTIVAVKCKGFSNDHAQHASEKLLQLTIAFNYIFVLGKI